MSGPKRDCKSYGVMNIISGDETGLEDLRGQELGIPQKLPPFDPERDVPEAPDYSDPNCWLMMPEHFS